MVALFGPQIGPEPGTLRQNPPSILPWNAVGNQWFSRSGFVTMDGMPPEDLLSELLRIAKALGLEVRAHAFRGNHAGPGGLCSIRGKAVVILNQRTSVIERITVLGDALAGRNLSALPMPDPVRGFIVERARSRSRLLLPKKKPGPGLAACRPGTRRHRGES